LTHIFDPIMPQAREIGENLKQFLGVLPAVGGTINSLFGDISALIGGFYSSLFGQSQNLKGMSKWWDYLHHEERYDWFDKIQPKGVLDTNFGLNSGMFQLPGVGDRKLGLSSYLSPGYQFTFFDKLRVTFEDLSKSIEDLKLKFEDVGKGLGALAVVNFDGLVFGLRILRLAFNLFLEPLGRLGGGINWLLKLGEKDLMEDDRKTYHLSKDVDFFKEADDLDLDYWMTRQAYRRYRVKDLSPEEAMKKLGEARETLPFFASGGIVQGPTLGVIGESGPEAIVPLKRSKRSLGLLDAAAGAIGVGATSGPQMIHKTFSPSITVNVNGSHTEGIGQLVAEAVLEALQKAQEEDYRRVAG